MLEALTAAIVAASPIHSPHPRRRMRASSAVAARASITPASEATAASPRHRQVSANTTSASHSQANQGCCGRLKENGSATGTRPVCENQFARADVPTGVAIGKQRPQTLGMGECRQQQRAEKHIEQRGTSSLRSRLRVRRCWNGGWTWNPANQIGRTDGNLEVRVLELVLLAGGAAPAKLIHLR